MLPPHSPRPVMYDDGSQIVQVAARPTASCLVQIVQDVAVHVKSLQWELHKRLQLHSAVCAPAEPLNVQT